MSGSSSSPHFSPMELSYAHALLELANERQQASALGEEVEQLRGLLAQEKGFRAFLANPSIGHEQHETVLRKAFGGRVSDLLLHFLLLVNAKGRAGDLSLILDAFDELLQQQLGKVEVDVTVAHKLSPQELDGVRARISKALKKDAVVHQYVDPSILGGLVVRVGDRLIDGSVKAQLESMRKQLLGAELPWEHQIDVGI